MKLFFLLLFKWKFTKASLRLASGWDSCALKASVPVWGSPAWGRCQWWICLTAYKFLCQQAAPHLEPDQSSKQTPKLLQNFQNFTPLSTS